MNQYFMKPKRQPAGSVKALKEQEEAARMADGINWMQSKNGTWHLKDATAKTRNLPMCQSYNMDKPNLLIGEKLQTPPEGAKICKKCLTHIK